jgi:hypothetical protein
MRQAINNNPMVQVAVLGGLAVIVGLFFMLNMKKGSSDSGSTASSAATPATSSAPATAGTASAGSASSIAPTGGSTPATIPSTSSTTSGSVSPEALVPGPGLPRPVIDAWKRGDTVVLLIARQGGIDDRLVRTSVRLLGVPGTTVFVTRANKVARYSRITQGVGVSQAPALVVIRPKRVSGSTPEAQVAYGFRNAQGVVQAVHDAVYSGKDNLPYSPR